LNAPGLQDEAPDKVGGEAAGKRHHEINPLRPGMVGLCPGYHS
jgi:hypothetical protein